VTAPYAQPDRNGKPGRDHHHTGSSTLPAGGIKVGLMHGATDAFGDCH
jgi:hypothetical protein